MGYRAKCAKMKKLLKKVFLIKITFMIASLLNPVMLFEVRDMTETNNADKGLTYVKPESDLIDELAAIDAAERKADLAEYQRQGALDRDGKPIHL